ncbi:hypothetical protein [Streptomyces sp. NPDC060194]|uniref:hypothetical protein n=1 Tax=Streptomyces sp. NPDC060194 TaxID=3347069 RepID=UPI0036665B0D
MSASGSEGRKIVPGAAFFALLTVALGVTLTVFDGATRTVAAAALGVLAVLAVAVFSASLRRARR